MRLAGPEVEAVRIVALPRRSPQRGRRVVNVGVGERRPVAQLVHEAIDDPARLAAAERARQPCRPLGLQRAALGGVGAGFVGAHERGAELRRGRAGDEDGRDAGAIGDPARRDERQIDIPRRQAQQRQDPEGLALVAVEECAAMAPGLDALQHDRVSGPPPPPAAPRPASSR